MMFTGHATTGDHQELGSSGSYGYGWFLGRLGAAELRYHTGHNAGFNSVSAWLPGPDLSVVALTNDDSSDVLTIARALLADVPRLFTLASDGITYAGGGLTRWGEGAAVHLSIMTGWPAARRPRRPSAPAGWRWSAAQPHPAPG
jgi:CubicO group peptidase (beta-lactamase class C family)